MGRTLYFVRKTIALLILAGGAALLLIPLSRSIERGRLFDDDGLISLMFMIPTVAAFLGIALATTWGRWLAQGIGLFWLVVIAVALSMHSRVDELAYALLAIGSGLLICLGGREMTARGEVARWERRPGGIPADGESSKILALQRWALSVNVALFLWAGLSLVERSVRLAISMEVSVALAATLLIGVVVAGVFHSRRASMGLFLVAALDVLGLLLILVSSRRTEAFEVVVFFVAALIASAVGLVVLGWVSRSRLR